MLYEKIFPQRPAPQPDSAAIDFGKLTQGPAETVIIASESSEWCRARQTTDAVGWSRANSHRLLLESCYARARALRQIELITLSLIQISVRTLYDSEFAIDTTFAQDGTGRLLHEDTCP
jgi:hypothetical protein